MKYTVNPFPEEGFVSVPAAVVTRFLKLATPTQLAVLLWACKNGAGGFLPAEAAEALRISETEAEEALDFWTENRLLSSERPPVQQPAEQPPAKRSVRPETVKPDRNETVRRGLESPEIAFLLQEAQKKFGRALKQNEASTVVWLYDDEGVSLPLMLMLFEHAHAENNFKIGNIERTAVEWINAGITDVRQAEEYLVEKKARQGAWQTVMCTMGIPSRKPSEREAAFAAKWVNEWHLSTELLGEAYNICVDKNAKLSLPYIDKILEKWHSAGYTSVEQTRKEQESKAAVRAVSSKGVYDLKLAERMMLSDGEDEL